VRPHQVGAVLTGQASNTSASTQRLPAESPVRILVVDDNPVDVQVIRYALQEEAHWPTEMTVANDGQEAIDYLLGGVARGDVPRPDLVILDLNLPKRDGTEVLQLIRTSEVLSGLPVVVLSSYPEEVIRKMAQQANVAAAGYLTKPSGIEEFCELGKKLKRCYEAH
jgi:CheY-like chemotaxis protein